ncbi:tyrosine-type recombinase/integrase [Streptomyces indicus]|uniref:Site-specific recombinase XerD n=1 Tax=Streptomyces indicus TaxID=417292 RepID=A0A1G9IVN5_9ACTN|nr:tyrosine-type recombinase/integrase [Streptomyces indicus]SDL29182.1 Site-specific recombinase XerD [Streptomyces indicus]
MPRKAANNPRQLRIKSCGCKLCTAEHRPGEQHTRKDCTGPWQARYRDPSGKQRSKCFKGKNAKKKAEGFLDNVRDQVRTGTFVDLDRGQIIVNDWYAKWWPAQRVGDTTRVRNEGAWANHVQPHFGTWPLVSIGYLDVEEWIVKLGKVTGVPTITKAFQLLDRMMTAAVRDRRIAHNPCDGVKLPRARPKHPDDQMPPTYDQLAAIRAHIPEFYHPLLIVAEETGLRWGELTGLRRCWVNFKDGSIQVRETVIEISGNHKRKAYPKSAAGCRTVPLSDRAAHAMKAHLEKYPAVNARTSVVSGMHAEELVFRSPQAGRKVKGRPEFEGVLNRNNFRRLWLPAIRAAGVAREVPNDVTGRLELWPHVHDIRHAFASRLHALGVSEADAQRILGHERGGKVTWLYTHAGADSVDKVRAALTGETGLRVVS